ncbi:MAG: B12-binding domain-containing radical SAM protein [Candidatus Thermoplasmatota archaeon]|nr:B12-binding domain-containing radical SAM protein [Candidatus Thermoplasmatota archaeon]MBU1941034.1 B12-binding domain-containing radical SAM protein [Candidatus Thermoplasmatota archaeon]
MNIGFIYPDPLKHNGHRKNKITDTDSSIIFSNIAYRPNLTLLNLAAVTPENHTISVLDDTIDKIPMDNGFDVVAITSMTNNIQRAYELADGFRSLGTKVVLGGWHPSALPNEAIQHADAVVIGEGEELWPQVLLDMENNKLDRFYQQQHPVDLSIIPAIIQERKLTQHKSFPEAVEATRGCPVGCKFCSATNRAYYRIHRTRPVDTVVTEVQHLSQKYFAFVDSSLTYNPRYARVLFQALIDSNKHFACSANINVIERDDKLLQLGAEAGLTQIFMGLESPSQITIDSIGKKTHTVSNYKTVIKKLHDYGFSVLGFFMFGFDTDTPQVFDETLDLMYDTEVDMAGCCILTPFPGTPLFDEFDKNGRLLSKDWSKYYEGSVVFRPKHMTPEQLLEGAYQVAKSFYSVKNIMHRLFRSLHCGFYPFLSVARGSYSYYRWVNQLN